MNEDGLLKINKDRKTKRQNDRKIKMMKGDEQNSSRRPPMNY